MQGRQRYCCGAGAPQAATCQQPPKQGYSLQEGRGSGGNSTPEMSEVGPSRGMRGKKGGHRARGALPASNMHEGSSAKQVVADSAYTISVAQLCTVSVSTAKFILQ